MKNLNYLMFRITIVFTMVVSYSAAQNKISLLRYDDDFSRLKNDSLKKGLEQLKYISIGNRKNISFGGELREQFQIYKNINFGDVPFTYKHISANQLWHRFMLHSNIELGDYVRLFVQLNSTLRFFINNPVVPEIDENQLSMHQAFVEIKLNNWKFRLGRLEFFYGNHRLLTVREGPNTRQAFDGLIIKEHLKTGGLTLSQRQK